MKFLIILLIALLTISAVSANSVCGKNICEYGHTCMGHQGVFNCFAHCNELTIEQKVVNHWEDGVNGPKSVQVQVTITNRSHQNIKDIYIASDVHLNNKQMWGVEFCTIEDGKTVMDLPNYANGIAPGASYSFGYVAQQDAPAHLWVEHIALL